MRLSCRGKFSLSGGATAPWTPRLAPPACARGAGRGCPGGGAVAPPERPLAPEAPVGWVRGGGSPP
eukprot:14197047-Alexandrium_andersonii.AAC.1